MRKKLIAAAGLAATVGLLAPAAVANAADTPADSKSTTVTMTVAGQGGDLRITASAGSITLTPNMGNSNVQGQFGTVTGINDGRTNVSPRSWVASVAMTDLTTGGESPATISADRVYYKVTGPTWDSNGTRENLASDWVALGSQPVPVYKRGGQTYVVGQYTSWTPNIKVELPTVDQNGTQLPAVPAGTYTGTLTTSVI